MKKLYIFAAALALATGLWAANLTVEPCLKSVLCRGLLEVYEFEEGNDSTRFGAFMGQLRERPGSDVPNVAGKFGNAVDFPGGTSNSYLWANGGGGLPATVSFWVYAWDRFPVGRRLRRDHLQARRRP